MTRTCSQVLAALLLRALAPDCPEAKHRNIMELDAVVKDLTKYTLDNLMSTAYHLKAGEEIL